MIAMLCERRFRRLFDIRHDAGALQVSLFVRSRTDHRRRFAYREKRDGNSGREFIHIKA
ncbi:hypothetical protein [Pandoraea communis]|uniref:hypothetical protein n=1 Tax=Pandoraea communis TaxID=2508297 RepID=UPI001582AE80|nr:hypothetical protein [Pandoraea communis]